MTTKNRNQSDPGAADGGKARGWIAGGPTGASNAGDGVDEAAAAQYEAGAQGRTVDDAELADMDTSGLVESQVTRPSTIPPRERPERGHNTERANRMNQRDALSHKFSAEDDAQGDQ